MVTLHTGVQPSGSQKIGVDPVGVKGLGVASDEIVVGGRGPGRVDRAIITSSDAGGSAAFHTCKRVCDC